MLLQLAKHAPGFLATHVPSVPPDYKGTAYDPHLLQGSNRNAKTVLQEALLATTLSPRPSRKHALLWTGAQGLKALFRPRPKSGILAHDLDYYRAAAEAILKGADTPQKRNAAITGAYAALFMKKPEKYLWCGLAAFASRQVGLGIRYWRIPGLDKIFKDNPVLLDKILGNPNLSAVERERLNMLLIRGNDGVYAHLFPAFLAFEDGGYAAVAALDVEPAIKMGFLLIENGEIQEGNDLLLRFEQEITLQTLVYNAAPELWALASRVIYMQLGLDLLPDKKRWTFFERAVPGGNIANFNERWKWIAKTMLPLWQALRDNELPGAMRDMMRLKIRGTNAKNGDYPF